MASFNAMFTNPVTTTLEPGETAQINWLVRGDSGGLFRHALVVGRRRSGAWYLVDQGVGRQFDALTLGNLSQLVEGAADQGTYWLWHGRVADLAPEDRLSNASLFALRIAAR